MSDDEMFDLNYSDSEPESSYAPAPPLSAPPVITDAHDEAAAIDDALHEDAAAADSGDEEEVVVAAAMASEDESEAGEAEEASVEASPAPRKGRKRRLEAYETLANESAGPRRSARASSQFVRHYGLFEDEIGNGLSVSDGSGFPGRPQVSGARWKGSRIVELSDTLRQSEEAVAVWEAAKQGGQRRGCWRCTAGASSGCRGPRGKRGICTSRHPSRPGPTTRVPAR